MSSCAVIVVHREKMLAEGLAAALSTFSGIAPVAVVTTSDEVRGACRRADAVAIDARLHDAAQLARDMRRAGLRVVMMATRPMASDETLWVSTDEPVSHLVRALVPSVRSAAEQPVQDFLTRREKEVLTLVARGLAGKQVARQLGISPKTVEQHKTRIFAKLGVPNQTAAVSLILGGFPHIRAGAGSR